MTKVFPMLINYIWGVLTVESTISSYKILFIEVGIQHEDLIFIKIYRMLIGLMNMNLILSKWTIYQILSFTMNCTAFVIVRTFLSIFNINLVGYIYDVPLMVLYWPCSILQSYVRGWITLLPWNIDFKTGDWLLAYARISQFLLLLVNNSTLINLLIVHKKICNPNPTTLH